MTQEAQIQKAIKAIENTPGAKSASIQHSGEPKTMEKSLLAQSMGQEPDEVFDGYAVYKRYDIMEDTLTLLVGKNG